MKRLYISDLDGTLLNEEAQLSEKTVAIINECIDKGVNFTVSTARTPATALQIIEPLNLEQPISMMNGALIYDMKTKSYLKIATLPRETVMVLLGVVKIHKLQAFVYGMTEGRLMTYYDSVESRSLNRYRNERIMKYDKTFTEVEDLCLIADRGIIYFMLRERKEQLEMLYCELAAVKGVKAVLYKDIYSDNLWYLEIFSENASKKMSVDYIRKYGEFDKVIGFGDNINDLPLFEACDANYAVANARREVQKAANNIIPTNEDDGVARFIEKEIEEKEGF